MKVPPRCHRPRRFRRSRPPSFTRYPPSSADQPPRRSRPQRLHPSKTHAAETGTPARLARGSPHGRRSRHRSAHDHRHRTRRPDRQARHRESHGGRPRWPEPSLEAAQRRTPAGRRAFKDAAGHRSPHVAVQARSPALLPAARYRHDRCAPNTRAIQRRACSGRCRRAAGHQGLDQRYARPRCCPRPTSAPGIQCDDRRQRDTDTASPRTCVSRSRWTTVSSRPRSSISARRHWRRSLSNRRISSTRAKGGKLRPQEINDGTFTITNLGAYGVETLIGIIQPPQVAILGAGTVMPQAVVRDGEVGRAAHDKGCSIGRSSGYRWRARSEVPRRS